MPKVFRDRATLIKEIALAAAHAVGCLITVDGVDGSGKTHFSGELAEALGAGHIEVDQFLDRRRGGYLEFLRYDELSRCLIDLNAGRTLIVDAVCVEEVVRRVGRTPSARVYVKRVDTDGHWFDGRHFDRGRSAEVVIAEERQGAKEFARLMGQPENDDLVPAITEEIILYHFRFRPHETADYIYERVEQNDGA